MVDLRFLQESEPIRECFFLCAACKCDMIVEIQKAGKSAGGRRRSSEQAYENFAAMQGFDFVIETDLEKIEQAKKLRSGMPCFPQDGYIEEFEEYIIINL